MNDQPEMSVAAVRKLGYVGKRPGTAAHTCDHDDPTDEDLLAAKARKLLEEGTFSSVSTMTFHVSGIGAKHVADGLERTLTGLRDFGAELAASDDRRVRRYLNLLAHLQRHTVPILLREMFPKRQDPKPETVLAMHAEIISLLDALGLEGGDL